MRVLVLSNLYPPDVLPGDGLACAPVVDALRGRRHEVQVLAARPRHGMSGDPPHVHRRFDFVDESSPAMLGRHPVAVRLKRWQSRVVNAFNVHVLAEALAEFEPEVIYVNNIMGIGGLGLLATLKHLGVPWVWPLGDHVPRDLCSDANGVIPGLAEAFAREVQGTYSVVSARVRDACGLDGLALNGRVELMPNWITGDRPSPTRRFYHPDRDLKIIVAGLVDAYEGFDLVVEAAHRLRREGIEGFTIDVHGQWVDPAFRGRIRSLGLDESVVLRDPRPHHEVLERYAEYDLLLFPSRPGEPFGLAPLEALGRGCVPLMSADCQAGEWLVHGVHCLKADRRAEPFAAAIQRVLQGATLLEPLARRGQAAVWRDFHLDAVLPRIEALLLEASAKSLRTADSAPEQRTRPAEAYRLARMAEQLSQLLIQDSLAD